MQNQIDNKSGNSFIDENHEELLKQMDKLTLLLRDNWDRDNFSSSVQDFITDIESHLAHEEVILRGAKFADLDEHTIQHRELALTLRTESRYIYTRDEAIQFMANTRSQIIAHEFFEDQAYWSLFEPETRDTNPLIIWSPELDTGDPETDKHHKALANYINHIHRMFAYSKDNELACRQLKTLYAYSEIHFSDEELLLGKNLEQPHKANHAEILSDLDALIEEVKAGKYQLKNIASYLEFWLINHIRTFDVPAFKHK